MASAPVLAFPNFDGVAPFILDVDASGTGLGAVLSQQQDNGQERVIAYASRLLSDAETRYAVTKRELLAAVWSTKHFRCYLLGRPFVIRTDHKALEHLGNFKDPPAQIARWLEMIGEFDFTIQYRSGRRHGNADGLSRQVLNIHSNVSSSIGKGTNRHSPELAEWVAAQQEGPDIRHARRWIVEGLQDADLPTGASPTLYHLWQRRNHLEMENGLVCRRWHCADARQPSYLQVVVPSAMKSKVLSSGHDDAGHFGESKTLLRLRAKYHWYGMRRDVIDWVRSCTSCAQRKAPRRRGQGAPLVSTWSGFPWERIAMDIVPNLPLTSRGNRHLLVVIDYFSKWAEAFPMPDMKASTIADILLSEIVARYGAPLSLHTDQGRNVDGRLIHEVCDLLQIRKTRTTAYHPASDGLVERLNQTLEHVIAHYVGSCHDDWDVHLPKALMAYRSAVQSSTGYTPHYTLFGREMRLPSDLVYGSSDVPSAAAPSSLWTLRKRLEDAHSLIRENFATSHQHQKENFDRKAVSVEFKEGDLVWLLVPHLATGQSSKFAAPWQGPYKVEARLDNSVLYRLRDTRPGGRTLITHINRMKQCYRRPAFLSSLPENSSSLVVSGRTPESSYKLDSTDSLYLDNGDNAAETWFCQSRGDRVGEGRRGPARNRRQPAWMADFYMY